MSAFKDISGKRFGRYTAIRYVKEPRKWECLCDCGNSSFVRGADLRNGDAQSCGCRWRDTMKKHGHNTDGKRTPTNQCWHAMIQRCTNPNTKQWADYGGRGIGFCDEWKDFRNFLRDMGEMPKGLTLDRIDNDKGYSKENCRWATRAQQRANCRNTLYVVVGGVRRPLIEYARETGISRHQLRHQVRKFGEHLSAVT